MTPDQIACDALRVEIRRLLALCSEKQQAFYHRLYPGSSDALDEPKLKSALDLLQRTVRKNEADPSRLTQ